MPPLDGFYVLEWPEFRAVCTRLGVVAEQAAPGLELTIPCDDDVRVVRADTGAGLLVPLTDGHEAYHWPEFRALCQRLGISWELGTRRLTLRIISGEFVLVTQQYYAAAPDPDPPVGGEGGA